MWIVGDSYVRCGEERARDTIGSNLGLDACVRWFGWGGLRWAKLVPFFHQALGGRRRPDVLLIICGSNDMDKIKGVELVRKMKTDLRELHQKFPV